MPLVPAFGFLACCSMTVQALLGSLPSLKRTDCLILCVQFGIFANSGQICSATSRLLIQKSIAPQLLEKLKARAESINVTNPLDPDCRLGPVVSEGQHNKILKFIEVSHLCLSRSQPSATCIRRWEGRLALQSFQSLHFEWAQCMRHQSSIRALSKLAADLSAGT